MIEQNSINELFNKNSKNFSNSIENEFKKGRYARGKVFERQINKYLKKTPSKIFDYGCGTGRISIMLGKMGHDLRSVDPAAEHIEIAQSLEKMPNVTFEVLTDDYVFSEKTYDAVVSSSVFEFVPDADHYINNIKKTLKNDGLLFISFPNLSSLWRLYSKIRFGKKYKHFQFQKNLLSASEISTLFEKHGFVKIGSPVHYESVLDKKGLGFLNSLKIFGTLSLYTFKLKSS